MYLEDQRTMRLKQRETYVTFGVRHGYDVAGELAAGTVPLSLIPKRTTGQLTTQSYYNRTAFVRNWSQVLNRTNGGNR